MSGDALHVGAREVLAVGGTLDDFVAGFIGGRQSPHLPTRSPHPPNPRTDSQKATGALEAADRELVTPAQENASASF
jgi:hypothetical protein